MSKFNKLFKTIMEEVQISNNVIFPIPLETVCGLILYSNHGRYMNNAYSLKDYDIILEAILQAFPEVNAKAEELKQLSRNIMEKYSIGSQGSLIVATDNLIKYILPKEDVNTIIMISKEEFILLCPENFIITKEILYNPYKKPLVEKDCEDKLINIVANHIQQVNFDFISYMINECNKEIEKIKLHVKMNE